MSDKRQLNETPPLFFPPLFVQLEVDAIRRRHRSQNKIQFHNENREKIRQHGTDGY